MVWIRYIVCSSDEMVCSLVFKLCTTFCNQVAGSYFEGLGYLHVAHVTPGFHRYRRIEGPGRVGDFWILKFFSQVAGSYFEAPVYFDMAPVTPVCHRYGG